MGADTSGWVETRKAGGEWWDAAIRIDNIIHRQYSMFASLFGIRNGSDEEPADVGRFRAIAYGRGVPPGASAFVSVVVVTCKEHPRSAFAVEQG